MESSKDVEITQESGPASCDFGYGGAVTGNDVVVYAWNEIKIGEKQNQNMTFMEYFDVGNYFSYFSIPGLVDEYSLHELVP